MDTQNVNPEVSRGGLEKISFIILLITIILTPLAFMSTTFAPLDMIKTAVITFGVLISSLLYFISCLKNRNLSVPGHKLTISALTLAASAIVSCFASTNMPKAFFGQGFEMGTASFMLVLFLLAFLAYHLTKNDKDRFLYIFGAVIIPFIIIALFHIIRLIAGPEFMSFGIFQSLTATTVGRWSDLGLFSGIIALLSYISLRFIPLNKASKFLFAITLIASVFFIFIINSAMIWLVLGIVMLGIVLYEYSSKNTGERGFSGFWSKLPLLSTAVLIVCAVFVWKGTTIAGPVIDSLKAGNTEIALPWQLTVDIAAESVKESPLFGAGPNRFGVQYLKYKPQIVNPTQFWGVEFANGFALIPSYVITQGIVGIILWIVFLVLFFSAGYSALKRRDPSDTSSNFLKLSTFFIASFLLIADLLYVPSHTILFLTALFVGLFVSMISEREYTLRKFVPLTLIVIIAVCVLWTAAYAKKLIALGYFQGGISAINMPNNEGIDKAEANFKKAVLFDQSDIYYQALSEINILRINTIAQEIQAQAQKGAKTADPELVKQIGALVEEAIAEVRAAIALDPTNYYNHLAEARISEVASSLQVQNAYENAKNAYANAVTLNPYNPSIYLSVARLEASQNKMAEAQQLIGNALQLKNNYLEAIFLLSQIQVSQGNIKDAIISVQVATQINPNDPSLFFQLGLLHYNDKNYQGAVDALTQAVKLSENQYANAQYFLGLSYARLGKTADAIIQFENLTKTNPDNEEVVLILSNLKAGKSLFADAQPPIDAKPEKRKSLPIPEKKETKK